MKKPIVLHITPSLMIGGAEKFLVNLLNEFKQNSNNKFEHQVIYFKNGPNLKRIKNIGIKTYHINNNLMCIWNIYLLVKKIKPQCINSMLWSANLYARIVGKILKIPTICSIHSNHNSGSLNKDSKIKLFLDKLSLNWAHKITTVSKDITTKVKKDFPLINPTKIITIDNGINVSNKKNNTKNSSFTIGHVGRFVPVKNQELLIKSLFFLKPKIPNFKAIIVGYGELESKLKKLTLDLNLEKNIKFIKTNQPEKYYPLFDCFVLSSHSEGQSIALLEAMSFGIPSIVTSQKKHEIISHCKNGLICTPNNILQLTKQILLIANNKILRSNLSKQSLADIKAKFSIESTANKYLNLYQKCE